MRRGETLGMTCWIRLMAETMSFVDVPNRQRERQTERRRERKELFGFSE